MVMNATHGSVSSSPSSSPSPVRRPSHTGTEVVHHDALEPPSSHRAAPTLGVEAGTGQGRQHRVGALSSGGGLDAGSITGIVLGIVVFTGLVGTCGIKKLNMKKRMKKEK